MSTESPATPDTALDRFSWRVGRFVTLYSLGMVVQLLVGVVTTILVVRVLPPAQYGELGLYLLIPSTLLVVANLGLIQGTNHSIFAHAGENARVESDEGGDAVRRVLGTGLVLSVISGSVFALIVIAFAPLLNSALGHAPHGQQMVVIGAISGALAGGWRLASNTFRYARRPVAWAVAHTSRALFSLIAIALLMIWKPTVENVILGFGIGTLVGFAFSVWLGRSNVKFALDRGYVREIVGAARGWVVIVLAYHVVLSTGIYFVSLNTTHTQVGLFSLATSLAVLAHYLVSAYIYSSGPLRRSTLRVAVLREAGEARANASLLEGFLIASCGVILFLGVCGDLLVKIAPHPYAGAAALIPVLALPALGRGLFAFTYSLAPTSNKRRFQWLAALSLLVYVVGAVVVTPYLKAYAIGIVGFFAFAIGGMVQLIAVQRGEKPWPFKLRRVLLPPLLVAAMVPTEIALNDGTGVVALLIKLAVLTLYVLILWAADVVPLGEIARSLRSLRGDPLPTRRALVRRLRELSPSDAMLLRNLLRDKRPVRVVAAQREESERVVQARCVALLQSISDRDPEPPLPWSAARYLTFSGPYGERDFLGRRVIAQGADPMTLDRVEQVVARLRRLPRRAFDSARGAVEFDEALVAMFASQNGKVTELTGTGVAELAELDFAMDDGGDDDDGH